MIKVEYRPLTKSELKIVDIEKALNSDPPIATIIDGRYYWVTEVAQLSKPPPPPTRAHEWSPAGVLRAWSPAGVLKAIAVGVVLLFAVVSGNSERTPAEQRPSEPDKFMTVTNSTLGCQDDTYYDRLLQYAVDHDNALWAATVQRGLASGQCTTFEVGERVLPAGAPKFFSGLLKLRRPGDPAEYWVDVGVFKNS